MAKECVRFPLLSIMILDKNEVQLSVGDFVLYYSYWKGVSLGRIKRFSSSSVILDTGDYCLLNYQSSYRLGRRKTIDRLTKISEDLYNKLKKEI